MGLCQLCKRKVAMPFKCSYCGQLFCEEHRLPENHMCPNLPVRTWKQYKDKRTQSSIKETLETVKFGHQENRPRKISSRFFVLVVLLGVADVLYLSYRPSFDVFQKILENYTDSENDESPLFQLNRTKTQSDNLTREPSPEPPSHEELVTYALEEINRERIS